VAVVYPTVSIALTGKLKGNEQFMAGEYIRYDEDVAKIKAAVKEAVELAVGSIDNVIKPGAKVLVKPNLAFQAPPTSFAVVDPRTLEAILLYLKEESKAAEIAVGDNPSLGKHVGRARPAFEQSGLLEACQRGGADRIIYFDEEETVHVKVPGGKYLREADVFKPFLDADVVINVPKMKVHLAKTVTLGIANWQGILRNEHPAEGGVDGKGLHTNQQGQHRLDIDPKVVDEFRIRPADLVITDAVIGMEGQGPHVGEPIEMGLILAGTDTVAVDAVTGACMGLEPIEIPAVRIAFHEGLGEMRLDHINVKGAPISEVMKHFRRASGNPIGMYPGLDVRMQQTCPGCFVNIRGAIDNFAKHSGFDLEEYKAKYGDVLFIAGGQPDLDPEDARGKVVFLVGDCWEYFPSAPKIREALALASKVVVRAGCAPVYVFAQINQDLIDLGTEAGLLAHV
jgi:uncharacterized protein (DUF362 family)